MKNDLLRPLITGLLACSGYYASALSLSISVTHANCPAYTDGTAMANASGGTEPYTYLWNNGATTQQLTGLVPGIYNCTVTDGMGDTDYDVREVLEAAQYLHFGVQDVQGACSGGCSGMMWFDTTQTVGGVAPFTFNPPPNYWVGDVAYFTDLCPWEFNYSITDATGCTENTGVNISMPVYLLGNVTEVTPGCNGAPNGTVSYQLTLYDLPPGVEWPVTFIADDGMGNTFPTIDFEMWEGTVYGTIPELPPGDYTLYAEFPTPCGLATLSIPATVPDMGPDCGNVQGSVWYDLDQDCSLENGEMRIRYRVHTILPGPEYAIGNLSGFYSQGLDYGNYTIEQNSPDLDQICPANEPVPFTLDPGNQNVYIDFGDTSNIPFDLEVDAYLGVARIGFGALAAIDLWNGSVYPSEVLTVTCSFSPELEFASATVPPTVSTPGYLEWQLPALGAYGWVQIDLEFNIAADPGLIGTPVNITASVSNAVAEPDLVNNTSTSDQVITAAYDPNDKTARTSSNLSSTQYFLDEDNYVTYTIRFQNTGTDTAFMVVLRDTLEVDLDPGTLEILSSSHPFEPAFESGRTLVFTFTDILLPDSGTNEGASHGFVRFRIRPRESILVGDVISNTAGIYFDFNPPVITNTIELLVEMSTAVSGREASELLLWPNPAHDRLELRMSIADPAWLVLRTMDGRPVRTERLAAQQSSFDITDLPAGAYCVEVRLSNGRALQQRFIKY